MKNPIPPLIIILLAWVFGGSMLYNSLCCGFPGPALNIMDGEHRVAGARQNLIFSLGSSVPQLDSPVKNALSKTAGYLQEHPEKILMITGKFHNTEILGEEETPGLARALRTSEFLHTLGFNPDQIVVKKGGSEGIILEDEKVYGGILLGVRKVPNFSLQLENGDAFRASSAQNLRFAHSGYRYESPGPDVTEVMEASARYLIDNPTTKLIITGQYSDTEENNSIFPNLGLARANQIKNILQDLGVPNAQIETRAIQDNDLLFPGNLLHGGATYAFENGIVGKPDETAVTELENTLKQQNIRLYFERGENKLDLSDNERAYFASLIQFLDSKPSAKVWVEGHASITGDATQNQELSRERAEFVKRYLVQNGLDASQIIAEGRGITKPIASNQTEEGRAQNRRVEVAVK